MALDSLGSPSKRHLVRMTGFYLSVAVFVFFWLLAFNFQLYAVFIGWFDPVLADTSHFVHNIALATWVWVWGLAMLVQLYRPAKRITAMQVALLLSLLDLGVGVFGALVGGVGFEPDVLLFFGPVFIAAAIHPARGELVSFRTLGRDDLDPLVLGLATLAVVPVSLYVAGQLKFQFVLTDGHAELGHYATMSYFGLSIIGLALLAAVRSRGRRMAAYGAAWMAAMLGIASVFQPTMSGLDPTWSALAVVWAVALVGGYEWSEYRPATGSEDAPRPEPDVTS